MELEGAEVSAHGILDRYSGKHTPDRHTLIEVFKEHNEKQRKLPVLILLPLRQYERIAQSKGWLNDDPFKEI